MIHDDTNTPSLLLSNTSLLELGEGESTALADFPVVSDGLSTDGGAEERERANTESGGLGFAGLATAELASGLVKPGANPELPVLAEMVLMKD